MPVLIAASALLILFRSSTPEHSSFLDPAALRDRVATELPDGEVRDRTTALAEELVEIARAYGATTAAAAAAYAAHTRSEDFTAETCIEVVRPAERARSDTLRRVLQIRRQLLEVLSTEQWSALFH